MSKKLSKEEIQKIKAFNKRASEPIWFGFLAKDSEGNFHEGYSSNKSNIEKEIKSKNPDWEIIWISEDSDTLIAVINHLRILNSMSKENKEAYAKKVDPETFLKTLSKRYLSSIKIKNLSEISDEEYKNSKSY